MISLNNISLNFGGHVLYKNVSLQIKSKNKIGLTGKNGVGKSTLLKLILGKEKISSGSLGMPKDLKIGYLPQEASIFRGLSVEDNILAILEVIEPDIELRHKKLENLLTEFAIEHLRHHKGVSLSGGERRRVEIARALATDPSYLLLDEPFAGIDPIAVNDIRELVSMLKNRGVGVLITDYNVRETLGIIDRAIIVHDGHMLTDGKPEEIIKNDDARRLYLGEAFEL